MTTASRCLAEVLTNGAKRKGRPFRFALYFASHWADSQGSQAIESTEKKTRFAV